MTKQPWREPTPEETAELRQLLGEIPTRVVTQHDWKSEAGRAFVKQVRELQLKHGVSLPRTSEILGLNYGSLSSVIAYWERPATASRPTKPGRQPRPLKRRKGESRSE